MRSRIIFILIIIIYLPMLLRCQSQFLEKGRNGITIGASSTVNKVYSTVAGVALFSYQGIVDLSISSGITTYGGETKGQILSPAISFYVLRGEESRLFLALHAAYTSESVSLESSDNDGKGFSCGLFCGLLANSSHKFAVLPTIGILFQNSSNTKTERARGWYFPDPVTEHSKQSSFIAQMNVSIYIPTVNRNALVIDLAYIYYFPLKGHGVDMFGVGLSYVFSLGQ